MIDATAHVSVVLYPEGVRGTSIHGGFCHGIYTLLRGIERTGAMYKTCKDMGMAYSKAWALLNSVEDDFGVKLTRRYGANGMELTDDAKELIAMYEQKTEAARESVNRIS